MALKRRPYSILLKLQSMEVAKETWKEAVARQFGMCMINVNELHRILGTTNLDKLEPHVIGFPREQLDDSLQESTGVGSAPLWIQIVCRGWHPIMGVLWNWVQESTLPVVFSVFPPPNISGCLKQMPGK